MSQQLEKSPFFAKGEKLDDAKQDGSSILDRLGEAVSSFFGYARGLIGLDVPDEDGPDGERTE